MTFLAIFIITFSPISHAQSKKLIVLLDWFPNPNHAPLFVAESQGFFKQEGIDVELIGPADPTDPPKLVAAGKADIAITYQPHFMQQVDQGLPLIRIATLVDKPLACLVILKNGHIKSLSDLKSKAIGYSGETDSVTLKAMLAKNHVKPAEVEMINVHYGLMQALLTRKVAAVTGMMRNFELIQMELMGRPGTAFYPEENGIPTYSELIFVANKNHVDDPRLKHFIHAVKRGRDYLVKHPEQAWQTFIKTHPALNDELNKRAWFETLPYFSVNPAAYNEKEWLNMAQFLLKNGLVNKAQLISIYTISLV